MKIVNLSAEDVLYGLESPKYMVYMKEITTESLLIMIKIVF